MKISSNFFRTADWLDACGKTPGNASDIACQAGVHIEEFTELLDSMSIASPGGAAANVLVEASACLKAVAGILKSGIAQVEFHDRVETLDALCDSEVTGNGLAYLLGLNKLAAYDEVLTSNESKLLDDGTALILPGGKIGKGPNYFKPDLAEFAGELPVPAQAESVPT